MRRYQIIIVVLLLLSALVGCAAVEKAEDVSSQSSPVVDEEIDQAQDESPPVEESPSVIIGDPIPDQLYFSSIEQLLGAYIVAKESGTGGEELEGFVSEWEATYGDSSLADVAESVNFTSLEKLYIPTGIPEDYELYRIRVNDDSMNFWYVHKNDMVSEEAIEDALVSFRCFIFIVTRWDADSSLLVDGMLEQNLATKEDLIDEKYLFIQPHTLTWVYETERFIFYAPLVPNSEGGIETGSDYSAEDMIICAETSVINLLDSNEVSEWMGEEVKNQVEEIVGSTD
ncbi:MAG: hypothetical protein LBM18_01175 [Oscillospiraceae bacterium]|nr:hypothetical protein [Oscillospiraceae bacterium]